MRHELQELVDNGQLLITYIDATPRSVSAALFRSLTHIHDASAYEPFKYGGGYANTLTRLLEEVRGCKAFARGETVKLVIKELARELPPQDWEQFLPLVRNVITLVRDPHLQLWSQMGRMANDIYYNQRGAHGLSDAQVAELAESVATLLEKGGTIGPLTVPGNFNRTAWADLRSHFRTLQDKRHVVVDGFLLRSHPSKILGEIVERLQIPHDPADLAQASGRWSPESAQNLKRGTPDPDSAYRHRAAGTQQFEPPLEDTPCCDQFPAPLQAHLKETALPTYLEILSSPHRVGSMQGLGPELVQKNPVTIYANLSARKEPTAHLREAFPRHAEVFAQISRYFGG